MFRGLTVLVGYNASLLSDHILIIDTFQIMFTVSRIYSNPFYTIGLQYQATWRALCLGLRIRHVSRGEGESFVPQNPLILRDHVPSSFVRILPPVSETRVSPLFEVRVPPVLIEARAASCPRPTCLRFSRSLYLRLGFPICNPKELLSSNSNTYTYII